MNDRSAKAAMQGFDARLADAAIAFVAGLPPEEQEALLNWIVELLDIREREVDRRAKLKAAFLCTKQHRAIWPIMKSLKSVLVKHGWTKRGKHARWGIAGSAIAIAVFGFQGAGIAALGGAIGVPLWIIFGGGAALASLLRDELSKKT